MLKDLKQVHWLPVVEKIGRDEFGKITVTDAVHWAHQVKQKSISKNHAALNDVIFNIFCKDFIQDKQACCKARE